MADAPADDSRKITITVKTPKEKKDIEIDENGTIKEVSSLWYDWKFSQNLGLLPRNSAL